MARLLTCISLKCAAWRAEPTRRARAYGRVLLPGCALALAALATGCSRDGRFQPISMWNESRLKPMERSPSPDQLASARALVPGTIARGAAFADSPVHRAREGQRLVTQFPIPITPAVLRRGQERFHVYCAPCHGRLGDGQGMVVKRGFPPPPDYAIRRLRDAPIGHYFDVVTNGYGAMYSYASRVAPEERWAIIAYIRVLQASRPEVPPERGREQRLRARETGIGVRPAPEPPGAAAEPGAAPGEAAPGSAPMPGEPGAETPRPPAGPEPPAGAPAPSPSSTR